jgi:hypothetical protein
MKNGVDTGEALNATKTGPVSEPLIVKVFPDDVATVYIEPGVKDGDEDVTIVIVCPGTRDAFGTVICPPIELYGTFTGVSAQRFRFWVE